MEEDYAQMLIKKINHRRAKYLQLDSKRRLIIQIKEEIETLEQEINDLDRDLSVLTPKGKHDEKNNQ